MAINMARFAVACALLACASYAAEGPTTAIATANGDAQISSTDLDFCKTGDIGSYTRARQLARTVDDSERSDACARVGNALSSADPYLSLQYYRLACESLGGTGYCKDAFKLLDAVPPERHNEAIEFAISVCRSEEPIVGRTPYKLAVDLRGELCYQVAQKVGDSFPKTETELADYKTRVALEARACGLGHMEACNDVAFECDTYRSGCTSSDCGAPQQGAMQSSCSAAVSEAQAKRFVVARDRADDEREKQKQAAWNARVRAADERERAAEAARQARLADTLATIESFKVGMSAAISGTAKPPSSGNNGSVLNASQIKASCDARCNSQMAECQGGSESGCYRAAACQCQCTLDNAPNDPAASSWRSCVTTNTANANALIGGPRFVPSGNVPNGPPPSEPTKPFVPPPPCPPGRGACVGDAR
jgi:hypothetical protein